jgi:hypothetical protein
MGGGHTMNGLNWRAIQSLGLAGVLGLLMLGAAAWLSWSWLPQQRAQVGDLGSQARRARHGLQAKATQPQASEVVEISSPEQAWQTLWQALPTADKRLALQSAVLAAAKDKGLLVSAVQYQGARTPWSAHEGAVLWRQRLIMPVEGSYPAVRAWLAQVSQEPALSLDEVNLQRPDVMSDQVKARVSVSLWWRKQERAQP